LTPTEINKYRIFELNKYRLSLYLNREIQQEILYGGEFVNNKINNEILANKFNFNEDKTNNLYLSKKIKDYFILIHFKLMKPNIDRKRNTEYNNELIEEHGKNIGNEMGIFKFLTSADTDPGYIEAKKEHLQSEGLLFVEEYFNDFTPFHFNINILNKKSETLQYVCYSEENKVYNL
jgi:hypothetical protein